MRVLIVDDEAPARLALRHRLAAVPDVRIVGEASGVTEAIDSADRLVPDVLFLDIQMSDGDGFDVLDALPAGEGPLVVFVTAYDEYAVAAFEARALDYVLKPVSRERLRDVVERVRQRLSADDELREHRRLLEQLRELRAEVRDGAASTHAAADGDGRGGAGPGAGRDPATRRQRIAVRRRDGFTLVEVDDIDWLEAAGNYVRIHAGASAYLHRIALSELEARLPSDRFARVHRSAVVNLDRVERVVPTAAGDFEIHLETGAVVRMSRSYRDRVLS